jgi:hypothetical protein
MQAEIDRTLPKRTVNTRSSATSSIVVAFRKRLNRRSRFLRVFCRRVR